MSDMEKEIDLKLANARKLSESKPNESPKKGSTTSTVEKKGQNTKPEKPDAVCKASTPAEKKKEATSDTKSASDSTGKPVNKSDDRKKTQPDEKGTVRKVDDGKAVKPSDKTSVNKEISSSNDRSKEKSNPNSSNKNSTSSSGSSGSSTSKVSSGSNDKAKERGTDKGPGIKKANNGKTNGAKISDGDNWDDCMESKSNVTVQDKSKVSDKNNEVQEKDKKEVARDKDKKEVARDKDKKDVTQDKDKKNVEDKNKNIRSSSKSSRGKSRSPTSRSYYRGTGGYVRGNPPRIDRRSPVRGRSRSPMRRRSRSPTRRRSPSPRHYRDTRRWSPRRRSRSPRNRRSRSRSRRDLSSDKFTDPKALRAKKSFLDDLAVQFAQEGKEFPELEQYRCEINSQIVSYPSAHSTFAQNAVEHICADTSSAPMYMDLGPHMENPMMMPNPYNAYPMTPAVFPDPIIQNSPLTSYPISGLHPMLESPTDLVEMDSLQKKPKPQIQFLQDNKMAISDLLANQTPSLGSQAYNSSKKGAKLEVTTRISQALKLLDDLGLSIIRSTKFMYRAPTFYDNNVNENRSPVVQSPTNPLFAFNSRSGETSDPFGNVPHKIKPIIHLLCMDEGSISEKIFRRQQKGNLVTNIQKLKLEADEQRRRQQMAGLPKPTLQKTTQTEPTVCTECLIRKIKIRANCETQTVAVCTVDSVAQTNPMPVQTVTEFGSITELTPNQVRAVSELIKYIKLTATSGTLMEMRDTMQDDQVYALNGDLRTAYKYFDAMVETKTESNPPPQIDDDDRSFTQKDDYNEVENYNEVDSYNRVSNYDVVNYDEDALPMDEYEQYHQNFCDYDQETNISGSGGHQNEPEQDQYDDDEPFQGSSLNTYERLQQGPFGFDNNSRNTSSSIEGHHPYDGSAGRGQFKQQHGGGRGRGKNNPRGRGKNNATIFNRRN